MNRNISSLYKMAGAKHRNIIGLMSGTSLDGLDLAYCKIWGHGLETKVKILAFETIDYSEDTKEKIRKIFAKENINFPYLSMLNEWIGSLHGNMVKIFMANHKIDASQVDVIASHGQTVMHSPKHQHRILEFPNATLQIGDGDHIAMNTGIITISDFRQKHLAAGGEGAPLAVYGDYLIFSESGEDRIMLNMGGIGNFTFLPGDGAASRVFVTDTGPGNTLMDAFMKNKYNRPYDYNAELAKKGSINHQLLTALKNHYFFKLDFPKTTGPEVFNMKFVEETIVLCGLSNTSDQDIMATLNYLSAVTITDAIRTVIANQYFHIYMSGGGAHNPLLVKTMQELLPDCTFDLSDKLGIMGDAKEAVLFAVLANETIAGNPIDFGVRQGVPGVCMGKISLPQ
ncbi:MAG: anhydro-N-acetylmuramic acid kinase [Saprospiraceae bacterium]